MEETSKIRKLIRSILNEQSFVDKILDKISSDGIDSLSYSEKVYLDNKSNKRPLQDGFIYVSSNPEFKSNEMSFEYEKYEMFGGDYEFFGHLRIQDDEYRGFVYYNPLEDKINSMTFVNVVDLKADPFKEHPSVSNLIDQFCLEAVRFLYGMIAEENGILKEGADVFYIRNKDNNVKRFDTYDKDAIPFLYWGGDLIMKNVYGHPEFYTSGSHWEIVSDMLNKLIENGTVKIEDGDDEYYRDEEEDLMKETDFNGRLWTDSKVIAFWKKPANNAELMKIVKDLNADSMGKFHIDDTWKIKVGVAEQEPGKDYFNEVTKLIPLSEYTGKEGEVSDEQRAMVDKDYQKWVQHILSPVEKHKQGLNKVPAGFGSKSPKYAWKRELDRIMGVAEVRGIIKNIINEILKR